MKPLTNYQRALTELHVQINEQVVEFNDLYHHLQDIPSIGQRVQIVIVKTESDISLFPDAHHLAS